MDQSALSDAEFRGQVASDIRTLLKSAQRMEELLQAQNGRIRATEIAQASHGEKLSSVPKLEARVTSLEHFRTSIKARVGLAATVGGVIGSAPWWLKWLAEEFLVRSNG